MVDVVVVVVLLVVVVLDVVVVVVVVGSHVPSPVSQFDIPHIEHGSPACGCVAPIS